MSLVRDTRNKLSLPGKSIRDNHIHAKLFECKHSVIRTHSEVRNLSEDKQLHFFAILNIPCINARNDVRAVWNSRSRPAYRRENSKTQAQ